MKPLAPACLIALCTLLCACAAEQDLPSDEAASAAQGGKEDAARAGGGRFEVFTGKDGKTYFHLLAGNGQLVLRSQGYTTRAGAEKGIDSVRENGALAERFQLLQAADGEWYFNLRAGNGQVVATGGLYVSRANAERGIGAVVSLLSSPMRSALLEEVGFEVFRGLDGKYYFHLRADNGEIVLQSQGYTARASAVDGTWSVLANGSDPGRYQLRDAANGQAYFVLVAANGRVIGVSETYASRAGAERGAAGVAALLAERSIAGAE